MKLKSIFHAHFLTQQFLVLHGSSGFGKTAMVTQYVKEAGADFHGVRLNNLDPLTLMLPVVDHKGKEISLYYVDWMKSLFEATKHTVVFFDELTRPSSSQVFDLVMELVQERTFNGKALPDNVQFIGATNFATEDVNVKEIPNALWTRATHLTHAPTLVEMMEYMDPKVVKFLSKYPDHIKVPLVETFPLEPIPRQYEACIKLYNTKLLDNEELRKVCIGRLGLQSGSAFSEELIKETVTRLPALLTRENFDEVHQFEKDGKILEVITFLGREGQDPYVVGLYLAQVGMPETCRTFMETKKFQVFVKKTDFDLTKFRFDEDELPWQLASYQRNALSFKKEEDIK